MDTKMHDLTLKLFGNLRERTSADSIIRTYHEELLQKLYQRQSDMDSRKPIDPLMVVLGLSSKEVEPEKECSGYLCDNPDHLFRTLKDNKPKPPVERECWCMTSDKWNLEWAYCPSCGAGKTRPVEKSLAEKFVDELAGYEIDGVKITKGWSYGFVDKLAAIAEEHYGGKK